MAKKLFRFAVNIYSGQRNPDFIIDEPEEEIAIKEILVSLVKNADTLPEKKINVKDFPASGYSGFVIYDINGIINNVPAYFRIGEGSISYRENKNKITIPDAEKKLERRIIKYAERKKLISPDVLTKIRKKTDDL